ncbi:MAG: ABC transporter permease [Candidatus Omnitrophica bacterium]|nr:ABC transporter permease [Candidatus Omnitrophota bacterium]
MNTEIKEYLSRLGKRFLDFIYYVGGIGLLGIRTVFWLFVPPLKRQQVFSQMTKIGLNSLFIVFLCSLFTGIVLVFQSAYQLQKLGAERFVAHLVALSMCRELGPVFTALVLAGRAGASISAELGTMRVTEQIDALETMATNPIKYLVVPRFLALVVMLPLLTIYANFIGIFGGYIVAIRKLGLTSTIYINSTFEALALKDIFSGLFKSLVFGVIICCVSCYQGLNAEGGAEGVGKATTLAVVISFILIIAADCLFTAFFYFV